MKLIIRGIINCLLVSSIIFSFAACKSSSDSSDDSVATASNVKEAQFIDSVVEGLQYKSASQNGVTDENGTFKYVEGEAVTFFVGGVELGNTTISESGSNVKVTPLDLVPNADASNDQVNNMVRFLLTLNENGNDSKIVISAETRNDLADNNQINFNQSADDFKNDPNVDAVLTEIPATAWKTAAEAKKHFSDSLISIGHAPSQSVALLADFEDKKLSEDSYWNGSDESGKFKSGKIEFNNNYKVWPSGTISWDGFAYSNKRNTTDPGLDNQYSVISGSGSGASNNYSVIYKGFASLPTATLDQATELSGFYINNTTYAYLSMRDGDSFAKKFSDASDDWFKVTIVGKDENDQVTGNVDFYLADFRDADTSKNYIIKDWTWVDLSKLGRVKKLELNFSSSDVGKFGMKTPAYCAIDNIYAKPTVVTFDDLALKAPNNYWRPDTGDASFDSKGVVFEHYSATKPYSSWTGFSYSDMTDNSVAGVANQGSVYAGSGYDRSKHFGLAYAGGKMIEGEFVKIPPTLTLPDNVSSKGFYITNTTWGTLSMKNGDNFAKKFGCKDKTDKCTNGSAPDWFKITVTGKDSSGKTTGTKDFYLADFRFDDNSKDYIVDEWKWVDLTSLGKAKKLEFTLSSSDTGAYGMNTPAYFAIDNLTYSIN